MCRLNQTTIHASSGNMIIPSITSSCVGVYWRSWPQPMSRSRSPLSTSNSFKFKSTYNHIAHNILCTQRIRHFMVRSAFAKPCPVTRTHTLAIPSPRGQHARSTSCSSTWQGPGCDIAKIGEKNPAGCPINFAMWKTWFSHNFPQKETENIAFIGKHTAVSWPRLFALQLSRFHVFHCTLLLLNSKSSWVATCGTSFTVVDVD